MSNWYAIYTNPQCELRAASDLRARGMRTYVPMSKRLVRKPKSTGRVERTRPAYVRYVFVTDGARPIDFGIIHRTNGVQEMVSNAGWPVPIRNDAIEAIMAAEDMGLLDADDVKKKRVDDETRRKFLTLRIGSRVLIPEGVLAGQEGELKRINKSRRTLSLSINNFLGDVEISVDDVAVVE